ncbi:MAG: c-type cytochrome [Gemmatimonadales bacterium]
MITRWLGLSVLILCVACGGERRESPAAGTEGATATDTATAPAAGGDVALDTAASAPSDTAAPAPAPSPDTAARQQAQRPATPPAPAKPAPTKPKPAPTPKPAPAPETTATAQDTGGAAQETGATATADTGTADTTTTDTAAGQTQTATEPLRDAYHQAPKDTVDQATYNGWKQYSLNCARCHGEDVLGTTIAPHLVMSLKPDGPINTPEAFMQVVCAGRPEKGMPSWCALGMDPAKINQIYSYVKGRSEGKIGPGRPAVKQEG